MGRAGAGRLAGSAPQSVSQSRGVGPDSAEPCRPARNAEDLWDTSVALWFVDRLRCLVDLGTEEEGRSDLVLDVDVFENGPGYASP